MIFAFSLLAYFLGHVNGHGQIVIPNSTRHGGALSKGGDCSLGECYWFSNNVEIPGEPTLPNEARSVQLNVTGTPNDVYRTSPWRAPGSAKVYGSGCGSAGGGPVGYLNGGWPPKGQGIEQGMDGVKLPSMTPVSWKRGSDVEVAWAIAANHGGGYSWRLCPNNGNVSEECFQNNQLKFVGDSSWIVYTDGRKVEFPTKKVSEGTFPKGSEWARDPVPGCYVCEAYETCGAPLTPVPGWKPSPWNDQVDCYASCDGTSDKGTSTGACVHTPQFPEASPGISGFKAKKGAWDWSIMDLVHIPENIDAGDYLLGWRWDCEESTQVWENCADIKIV